MTVPGILEKADDKEKLVTKADVGIIMPNRERLIKIRKKRHILRLIISFALAMLLLSTIFLSICYIKKIGPFKRIFRGRCAVGNERHTHHKVYESYEITDDYALINVPKFHIKWGTFQSVKTLHVFKKKLTVIQYNGVCFVKQMLNNHGLQKDWFERIGQFNRFDSVPNTFTHIHWKMTHRPFSYDYLMNNVHNMAAAMCVSRPIYYLKFYLHPTIHSREPCYKKCEKCNRDKQFHKWEMINGQYCRVCYCKPDPPLKSSTHVDGNCITIRCQNKCNGQKLLGCVQCRCADQETETVKKETPLINDFKLNPMTVENDKDFIHETANLPDKSKMNPMIVEPVKVKTDKEFPEFQDKSKILPNHLDLIPKRKVRSASSSCEIVAEIFEGYSPLDESKSMPVDYIHNC